MKLQAVKFESIPLSYMQFPAWLFDKNSDIYQVVPDEDTAKEYYTLFWTISNVICQKKLAEQLCGELLDLEKVYNAYDYSPEALKFAKYTVDRCVKQWAESLKEVLAPVGFNGPWITSEYQEGMPLYLKASDFFELLHDGEMQIDFLINHKHTQNNFLYVIKRKMFDQIMKNDTKH